MKPPERGDITHLLEAWRQGQLGAEDRLFARLYPILRRLAAAVVTKLNGLGSWQATELLHEAFFHLREQREVQWQNRGHFLAIAGRVLRRTLVDGWRHRNRQKRGKGQVELPLDAVQAMTSEVKEDHLALGQALHRLACIDPMAARIVELLAVQGYSYEEAARLLGVGRATVNRGWRFGRTFLRRQMAALSTASVD